MRPDQGRRPIPPPAPIGYGPPVDQQTVLIPLAYDSSYAPEPELLTHRDDEHYEDSLAAQRAAGPDEYEKHYDNPHYDEDADDEPVAEDPLVRRKRRWRRIRRTGYVLAALFVIGPIVAFFIAYQFVDVPSPEMVAAEQKKPVTFLYAGGKEMDKSIAPGANRELVTYDQIPDVMRHAAYAAEDATFETNSGFDITGILRAGWSQVSGGSGGGSTITQQYIKQATGNDQHSYVRKAFEVVKAYKMNNQQSKQDIITSYLNTVYFGRGAYGIQAAAEAFFKKDVSKLDAPQAAFLAGLIQSPGRSEDSTYYHRRWNYVMDQMVAHKWLPKAERASAQLPARVPDGADAGVGLKGRKYLQFVEDRVKGELASKSLSWEQLQRSGAKIYTTLDPNAEQLAVRSAHEVMAADKSTPNLASALVSADPSTGNILAYYGGDDKAKWGYDVANTPHAPGSSFKPFVLTAALKSDPTVGVQSYYDGSDNQNIGGVVVHNADGESCPQCTVKQAMTDSVNTVFYRMAFDTGTQKVRQAALDAGLSKKVRQPGTGRMVDSLATLDANGKMTNVEAGIALGQYEVTPGDMAQGYATMANRGNYIPLHFVSKVTDATGKNVLYQATDAGEPAFDKSDSDHNEKLARNVTESMLDVAGHSGVPLSGGRESAAKTGTAQFGDSGHNQAAWMVGYTPQVVTSVWVGNRNKPGPIYGNYLNTIGPSSHYDIYGREEPSYIWQKYMEDYLADAPNEDFGPFEPLGSNENKSGKPIQTYEPPPTVTDTAPTDTFSPSQSYEPSQPYEPTQPTVPTQPTEPIQPGPGGQYPVPGPEPGQGNEPQLPVRPHGNG